MIPTRAGKKQGLNHVPFVEIMDQFFLNVENRIFICFYIYDNHGQSV